MIGGFFVWLYRDKLLLLARRGQQQFIYRSATGDDSRHVELEAGQGPTFSSSLSYIYVYIYIYISDNFCC